MPGALAKNGDGVRVAGKCTSAATAKLKLGSEDRGIEVEFEVDQNRNGVPWRLTLRRNGSLVASVTIRTHAPSGSFSLNRVIAGTAGTDRIVAVAEEPERGDLHRNRLAVAVSASLTGGAPPAVAPLPDQRRPSSTVMSRS